MTLENQVVSLDLAKELKALGVERESLFWWIGDLLVFKTRTGFFNEDGAGMNLHPLADRAIPAPTAAELGEMLASGLDMSWKNSKGEWNCRYETSDGIAVGTSSKSEADCRAKMLIHLIKNNLIPKPQEKSE